MTTWTVRTGGVLVRSALPLVGVPPHVDGAAAPGTAPLPVLPVELAEIDALPVFDPLPTDPEAGDEAALAADPERFLPVDGGWRRIVEGHGVVTIRAGGASILVERLPGGDDGLLSHVVLDTAVPRALVGRGGIVLHGTAVAESGHAVGFLGPSGIGKSTLAASFLDDGAILVADDCLVLRQDEAGTAGTGAPGTGGAGTGTAPVVVLPGYAALRLREESATVLGTGGAPVVWHKHLRRGPQTGDPVPLAALVLLERDADALVVSVEPLAPAQAALAVGSRSIDASTLGAKDAANPSGGVLALVRRLRPVVEQVAVVRLRHPSSYDALAAVRAAVREVAEGARRASLRASRD